MILKNKVFFYLKLFLILVLVYFVSLVLIKDIFLANSPKIRPDLGGYFLAKINNTKENILAKLNFNLFPSFNTSNQNRDETTNFLKNNLKSIAKGVSAYTDENGITHRVYTLNEVEWEEIKYTLKDGRQVTLKIPKGQSTLSQEDMEEMYQ